MASDEQHRSKELPTVDEEVPTDGSVPDETPAEDGPEVDLGRLHARDPVLLRRLVREITPSIQAAVRTFATDSDDAEDLVQECWIHILAKLDRFRQDGSFRAWAVVVSRNYCRETWKARKAKEIPTVRVDEAPEPASREPAPDEALERRDLRLVVRKALARLPDRERDAAVMKLMECRPTSDIARRLGVSETAVRKLIRRASYKLREMTELRDAWLP